MSLLVMELFTKAKDQSVFDPGWIEVIPHTSCAQLSTATAYYDVSSFKS
jgi:hypothetical protein